MSLSDPAPVGLCPCCGITLDERDRNVRFGWPDAVFALPAREETPGAWLSEEDPRRAPMMEVPGAGSFVRVLLPVKLTEGFSLTLGVWLQVSENDLRTAFDLWWAPNYPDLQLNGQLANAIAPWDILGAPALATVRHQEELPQITSSEDRMLQEVLTRDWPHADVLRAHRS